MFSLLLLLLLLLILLYELYKIFSLKLSEFCNDENVVLSYEFKLFDELYEFTFLSPLDIANLAEYQQISLEEEAKARLEMEADY